MNGFRWWFFSQLINFKPHFREVVSMFVCCFCQFGSLSPIPKKQADRNVPPRMMCLSLWHLCMATHKELGGNANSAVKSFKELGEYCWFFFGWALFSVPLGGGNYFVQKAETSQLISDRGRHRTGLKYLLKFWRFLQSSFSTKSASGANWQIERFQFEFVCKFWKLIN